MSRSPSPSVSASAIRFHDPDEDDTLIDHPATAPTSFVPAAAAVAPHALAAPIATHLTSGVSNAPVSPSMATASQGGVVALPSVTPTASAPHLGNVLLHPAPMPMPSVSPDVDYEQGGQGFVSKEVLRRSLSQRRPSGALLTGASVVEMEGLIAKPGTVPTTSPTAAEEKQPAGQVAITVTEGGVAPADAIWVLTLPQLNDKFPTSHINPAAPKTSSGLTSVEAAELLVRNGPNELKPPKDHPEWLKFLLHFTDPFMVLLLLAGILSACVAYPIDTSQEINLYIGIVLWGVVLLSGTFSYVQEGKASSVMGSFKNMLPAQARVIRDGREQNIAAANIVVGDLLLFGTGDRVPADCRLIWTQDCKVETSSLTGESLPITCSVVSPNTEKVEQAKNVCFNSSKCLEGESLGVVFATGDATLIGQIAGMAGATKSEDTTLQKEIKYFVKRLTLFSVIMGIVFFVIALARGAKVLDAFINTFIVVMIANVPEGLPMTVVSCLTITAKRLGQLNVFVKQLQSVETLGSVTVIATDKTGTLTQNIMAVANMWFDGQANTSDSIFQHFPPHRVQRKTAPTKTADGSSGFAESSALEYHPGATLEQLELIAVICSKTKFEDERVLTPAQAKQMEQVEALKSMDPTMTLRRAQVQFPTLSGGIAPGMTLRSGRAKLFEKLGDVMMDDAMRQVDGDASETALFNFVRQRQSIELLRYHHPKVYDIPFNSRNKYAITITKPVGLAHESPEKRTLLMKGAPEVIQSRCSHFMRRGEILPIDDRFKQEFQTAYESFGSKGQRVLGFAMLNLPEDKFGSKFDDQYALHPEVVPTSGLVFVGLVSLVDPPKASVPQAVIDCHTAGIKVIMVTGDHQLTAGAIARQVNIFQAGTFTREELAQMHSIPPEEVPEEDIDCIVVRGPELDTYSEADWTRTLSKPNIVFARTTPQQKLQIVEHLQAMGHVVAATGDGVNDSPALKRADIGVAMGINGSDVARDAAAVILMDDNFASIVVGVREGRTIFDNLSKTIAYTLTHMVPEVVPILLSVALGFPAALSSLMILTIDLFTETPPAVSMAYEPSEADVMSKMPRNAKTDRLVTPQIVLYAMFQAGLIECLAGFLAFFLVFDYYGMSGSSLFNTKYFKMSDNDDMPQFPGCQTYHSTSGPFTHGNVCFTNDDQIKIIAEAQTAYYAMLVTGQIFHVWFCKTRNLQVWEHGLFRNEFTIWGVALEICIFILVVFAPSSNTIFYTRPFPPRYWALIVLAPFCLGVWQEGRKWYVKRRPHGFIARKVHW